MNNRIDVHDCGRKVLSLVRGFKSVHSSLKNIDRFSDQEVVDKVSSYIDGLQKWFLFDIDILVIIQIIFFHLSHISLEQLYVNLFVVAFQYLWRLRFESFWNFWGNLDLLFFLMESIIFFMREIWNDSIDFHLKFFLWQYFHNFKQKL